MKQVFFFLVIFFVVSVRPAYAYLDPGAGSYIWQILAGSLLAFVFMAKSYGTIFKAKIQELTKSKKRTDEKEKSDTTQD